MFENNQYYHCSENSLILIEGDDKFDFIQGIISNDINILKKNTSLYSSLLTPQGRFLYDFFISYYKDKFLLECNKKYADEILKKLSLYKLRSNVFISHQKNFEILITNKSFNQSIKKSKKTFHFSDPRFKDFISRVYIEKKDFIELRKNTKAIKITKETYQDLRLQNFIPDFFYDSLKEKSLLLEMRFDDLNGISWEKGCYLGQEVTARMKYRGLLKKKIYGVKINYKTNLEENITMQKDSVGKLFSNNKKYGIALINCEVVKNISDKKLICGDSEIKVVKLWWAS